jgi:hypothetical protein
VPRARLALLLERFPELFDDREPGRIMYAVGIGWFVGACRGYRVESRHVETGAPWSAKTVIRGRERLAR